MSVFFSLKAGLVPIHKAGYPFIFTATVAAVLLWFIWSPLGWVAGVIALWVCYFFRDPSRITPQQQGLVISPADGRISMIARVTPPEELGLTDGTMLRISVFMSIFDCHVNRMPVAGKITHIAYRLGRFFNADLDKASENNERNGLVIETEYGSVAVVQVAGLIARRIIHWVSAGQVMTAGERFGLIRFGSRLDVYLPENCTVLVSVGQTALAGETVLADLENLLPLRHFHQD